MFEGKIGKLVYEVSHKLIPNPESNSYTNHIHNFCELLLFISGDVEFNIDGQMYSPKPYDLFLIPPTTYHYIIPNKDTPYENYVIDFSGELIPEKHYQRIFTPNYRMNIRKDQDFVRYFSMLDHYHAIYDKEDFDECALMLIRELLVYCSYQTRALDNDEASDNPLVRSIVDYVSENLTEALDAETIAKHLYLSKSYIQNIFSGNMHIGLKQYILQKKIYAAHAEIERGASPGEVCKKYQFNDYTGFYRLYKKFFGMSPKAMVSGNSLK